MNIEPCVSIIIPLKEINAHVREAVDHILKLDYSNYEIIILPDGENGGSLAAGRIVATGPVGPAKKRDLAQRYAKGEILAFLDDDAYPRKDWLRKAVRHFQRDEIAAVGGPAVTPEEDDVFQRASGAVFASKMGGGNLTYRYVPERLREVDDYPSVNLLVRKDIFAMLGGFDTKYWPGEDTKLCLDITKKAGKKIIYDPEVLVWHHRRPLFLPHLRQVFNYAWHRGHFVNKFPETSLKLNYFIPSLFTLGLFLGLVVCVYFPAAWYYYLGTLFVYTAALLVGAVGTKSLSLGVLMVLGTFLTHITYGIGFISGLLKRDSKE